MAKKGKKVLPDCKHNKMVGCEEQNCSTCGWNPQVEERRKKGSHKACFVGKRKGRQ